MRHLELGRVVIFVAGTGILFSTIPPQPEGERDRRGSDFKATKVDGIYTQIRLRIQLRQYTVSAIPKRCRSASRHGCNRFHTLLTTSAHYCL